MKPAKKVRSEMNVGVSRRIDAKIDTILATEEELIPSSGFLASVMERVEEEAAAPAPIRFPWKRAIPGIVLATGVFGWGAVEMVRLGLPAVHSITLTPLQLSVGSMHSVESVGWVAMALSVSLVSWLFSRQLAGRGGLL